MTLDFCKNWTFQKGGCAPVPIDLPHDAMILEKRDGGCRNGVNSGYFPGGKYTYEKVFEIAGEDIGKSIVLHFEGVYQNCAVSVNQKLVGSHRYGYTAFDVDISDAVRIAHHPASQITLDACDKLGMYVMNETFDGWYTPKTYHDYSRWFEADWKQDLTAMVESSRNHPCIIMYSIGNEVSETATEKGIQICKMLTDFVHSLDDTRPVTAGINVLLNVYANMGLGVYKDKGDYKPEPLPEKKGYREKKTGSAFFNAMTQRLGKLMFFMASGKWGDKASLGAAENLDIMGLNYASSRYDPDAAKYPDRMMVGAETMAADLPYNWARVKKYPQLIGDFVWSAWDYLGEACMGWTYHSYKGLPLLANQGMIDITGKPLASIADLKAHCEKKGLDFDTENDKYLAKQAKKKK